MTGKPKKNRTAYMQIGDIVTLKTPKEMMRLPGAVYNDVEQEPDPDFDEDFIYTEQDHTNTVYLVHTMGDFAGKKFTVKAIEGPNQWMPYRLIELSGENADDLVAVLGGSWACGGPKFHEWWLKRWKKSKDSKKKMEA